MAGRDCKCAGCRPKPQTLTPEFYKQQTHCCGHMQDVVGKDLSRVCLPVYFNEPLSALQRIAEEMEYSELLDQVRYNF